ASALANNTDKAFIVVLGPDLNVTKVADQAVINTGEQAGFTITLSNVGAGDAFDVALSDALPAGVAWAIDGPANGFSLFGNTLSFRAPALPTGEVRPVHAVGMTDAADAGVLTNPATASASNEPANRQGNNSATATITVDPPDLEVTK